MRSSIFIFIGVVLTVFASRGCEKEEIIKERDYPRIDISDKVVQSRSGVTFNGTILTRAGEITDKGFIWDEGTVATLDNSNSISLGPGYGTGSISAIVTEGLTKGVTYEIRGYLVSGGRVVYSKRVSFTSTIDSTPAVR